MSRHSRENKIYTDKQEKITFNNDNERDQFYEENANLLKNNFEINFQDLNNVIDKSILSKEDNNNNPKENFFKYYNGLDSFDKLIKLKRIEALKILLNIHNSIEELNRLALKKDTDLNIENFFNELKTMDEFRNEGQILEKLKEEFLIYNTGKNKNNLRFGILRESKINLMPKMSSLFIPTNYIIDNDDD